MKTFTFDTNCIIDIDQKRASAGYVYDIIHAHRASRVSTAFVAVSASERQQGDYYLTNYLDFIDRLKGLGLEDIPQIEGMDCWGISYWDHALYADESMEKREQAIHETLFQNIDFKFSDFTKTAGLTDCDIRSQKARKWRNAWCDRQMIWAHDYHLRDVFVTSDSNFLKLVGKSGFESLIICTPEEAAHLIP